MNTNLYHVIHKMPILEKKDMFVELEKLTEEFVNSGLLRIDAEPKQNFTRFSIPSRNVHVVFSKRELFDNNLIDLTKAKIKKLLIDAGNENGIDKKVNLELEKLKLGLKKFLEVEKDLEYKVARVLIQSAHPVVFKLIMLERVEVYVSFGHNIGEVMDIVSWRQAGTNSGMQSTDGKNVAVFVSCGGDPFNYEEQPKDEKTIDLDKESKQPEEKTSGDGIPALARFMAIAGQEIGHYSDIYRNSFGKQVGRYSANFSGTQANSQVNQARLTDLLNIEKFRQLTIDKGLNKIINLEANLQLIERQPKGFYFYIRKLRLIIYRSIFENRLKKEKFIPIKELSKNKYIGKAITDILGDMAFNLAPVADVYSNPDKNIETAIACIEALARVPQQVNKWGHLNTLFFWRNLYKIYYNIVIPGCIKDYEAISGQKFNLYPNKMRKYSKIEKINLKLDNIKLKLKNFFKR